MNDRSSAPSGYSETQIGDLPRDADGIAGEADHPVPPRLRLSSMGNAESREGRHAYNTAIHAAAAELKTGNGPRKSTGKLKSVPTDVVNPPYRDPRPTAFPRTMDKKSARVRADPYEVEESPDKRQLRLQKAGELNDFSPLKKARKRPREVKPLAIVRAKEQEEIDRQLLVPDEQEEIDQQLLSPDAQEAPINSPRRSRRQQEMQERDHIVTTSKREPIQRYSDAELDTQTAHIKSWFAERMQKQDDRADESPKDGAVDNVEVRIPVNHEASAARRQPLAKKRQGQSLNTLRDSQSKAQSAQGAVPAKTRNQGATHGRSAAQPQPARKQSSVRAQRGINARLMRQTETTAAGGSRQQDEGEEREVARASVQQDSESLFVREGYEDEDNEDEDDEDEDGIDDQKADGAEQDDEELPEDQHEELEQDQASLAPGVALHNTRPSEVFSDAHGDPLSSSSQKQQQQQSRKRKALASTRRASANSRAKRPRIDAEEEPLSSAEAEETGQAEEASGRIEDASRLYGQWHRLRLMCDAVKFIGVNYHGGAPQPRRNIKLRSAEVGTIINLCNAVMDKLSEGQEHVPDFALIMEHVDALHRDASDPDFTNVNTIKSIYFSLFPKLVDVLRHTVECYEDLDLDEGASNGLTIGHLEIVVKLIKKMIELGEGVKKYTSPDSSLALVRPVRYGILAPLKTMEVALGKILRDRKYERRIQKEQQREAKHRARAAKKQQRAEEQRSRVRKVQHKWHLLHHERIFAEGFVASAQKHSHLAPPEPLADIEIDPSGVPFERLEVFIARVGPSLASVEAAREKIWSLDELEAFQEGLERYTGPCVFEKIFRRYCGKNGPLRPYNVTEIVTCAADLKEYLSDLQQRQGGEVDDWVRAIPLWTKGRSSGKENSPDESEAER